jgi:hypothetical protein
MVRQCCILFAPSVFNGCFPKSPIFIHS